MSAFGINIPREQICVVPSGASKPEALEALIAAVSSNAVVKDIEAFRRAIFERESIMSTGIGEGIARVYAREGCKVVLTGRTLSKLEEVAKDIKAAGGEALQVVLLFFREVAHWVTAICTGR